MSIMRGVNLRAIRRDRPGVASLVVTVILCLTVIGIIASLTAISLSESQQASDQDQSSRAINAAQAGVEALVHKVTDTPNFQQPNCTGLPEEALGIQPSTGGSTQDIAITCATVVRGGTAASGVLQRDQSVVFDLGTAREGGSTGPFNGPMYFNVDWNQGSTDSLSFAQLTGNPPQFPTCNIVDASCPIPTGGTVSRPPAIEMTFTWCPKLFPNATATNEQQAAACNLNPAFLNANHGLPTYTTLIDPWEPNKDGITSDCNTLGGAISLYNCHIGAVTSGVPASQCLSAPFATSVCQPNIPAFGRIDLRNYNLKVKLTARYAGTHYQIDFGLYDPTTGRATVSYFNWPYSKINVTARSGDIYREVQATKSTQFASFDDTGYALFSGKNICKNLFVFQNVTDTAPGLTPGQNSCPEP